MTVCGLCLRSVISQHRHIPRRFFYKEARKPRTIGKNSWFPGFLMELILVAAPPRCVFALNPSPCVNFIDATHAGDLPNAWPGLC